MNCKTALIKLHSKTVSKILTISVWKWLEAQIAVVTTPAPARFEFYKSTIDGNFVRFLFENSKYRSKSRNRSSSDRSHSGEESNTLAIFNLYYRTDEEELIRIFERYGKIEVSLGKKINIWKVS